MADSTFDSLPTEPGTVIGRFTAEPGGFIWDVAVLLPHFSPRTGKIISHAWQMAGDAIDEDMEELDLIAAIDYELQHGNWTVIGRIEVPTAEEPEPQYPKSAKKRNPFDLSFSPFGKGKSAFGKAADKAVEETPEEPAYVLLNAESMHAQSPDTFWIEERSIRESLAPNALVKLCFAPVSQPNYGERMWVKVTAVKDGRYAGVLDNMPADSVSLGIELGEEVEFGPENIYDIWKDEAGW